MTLGSRVIHKLDRTKTPGVIIKDLGIRDQDEPSNAPLRYVHRPEQAWLVKFPHDTQGCWESDLEPL